MRNDKVIVLILSCPSNALVVLCESIAVILSQIDGTD